MEWLVTIKKTGRQIRVLADNAAHALLLAQYSMSAEEKVELARFEEEETMLVELCGGHQDETYI